MIGTGQYTSSLGIGTRKDLAKLSGLVLRQTDKGSNTFSLPRNTPLNVFMKKSVIPVRPKV